MTTAKAALAFRTATVADMDRLETLYRRCTNDMLGKGIKQWGAWNGGYPDLAYLRDAVIANELSVAVLDGTIMGAVILNEDESEEWRMVRWTQTSRVLVIHAFVIDPNYQGRGLGKQLLGYCERTARVNGYTAIRLDAFVKNEISNTLYQHAGYTIKGRVRFETKPDGNKEYYCYEKVL